MAGEEKKGWMGRIGEKVKEASQTEQGKKVREDVEQRAKGVLSGIGEKVKGKLGGEKKEEEQRVSSESRPSAESLP